MIHNVSNVIMDIIYKMEIVQNVDKIYYIVIMIMDNLHNVNKIIYQLKIHKQINLYVWQI